MSGESGGANFTSLSAIFCALVRYRCTRWSIGRSTKSYVCTKTTKVVLQYIFTMRCLMIISWRGRRKRGSCTHLSRLALALACFTLSRSCASFSLLAVHSLIRSPYLIHVSTRTHPIHTRQAANVLVQPTPTAC